MKSNGSFTSYGAIGKEGNKRYNCLGLEKHYFLL